MAEVDASSSWLFCSSAFALRRFTILWPASWILICTFWWRIMYCMCINDWPITSRYCWLIRQYIRFDFSCFCMTSSSNWITLFFHYMYIITNTLQSCRNIIFKKSIIIPGNVEISARRAKINLFVFWRRVVFALLVGGNDPAGQRDEECLPVVVTGRPVLRARIASCGFLYLKITFSKTLRIKYSNC